LTNTTLPKLTFNDITWSIIHSGKEASAKRYAKAWDNVVSHYLAYRRPLTASDWGLLMLAVTEVQFKK
jgi:hypothetical protein